MRKNLFTNHSSKCMKIINKDIIFNNTLFSKVLEKWVKCHPATKSTTLSLYLSSVRLEQLF